MVISLLGTVHGLVSERDRVSAAFATVGPSALALGMSSESVAMLGRYAPDPAIDPYDQLTADEMVYSDRLSRFGEVDLPPPDVLHALALAKGAGIDAYGVDLSEEAYEELYTTTVNAWQFLRYGHVQRRLAKRPPEAPDARSFSLAWDARRLKNAGVAKVEARREEHIARTALALAERSAGPVLLLVDVPREQGVARWLDKLASPGECGVPK